MFSGVGVALMALQSVPPLCVCWHSLMVSLLLSCSLVSESVNFSTIIVLTLKSVYQGRGRLMCFLLLLLSYLFVVCNVNNCIHQFEVAGIPANCSPVCYASGCDPGSLCSTVCTT